MKQARTQCKYVYQAQHFVNITPNTKTTAQFTFELHFTNFQFPVVESNFRLGIPYCVEGFGPITVGRSADE